MGHTWTLKDGTVVRSGGTVEGTSDTAQRLRDTLADVFGPEWVTVGPLPDGRAQLDVDNDFLLHAFVQDHRFAFGYDVETDYEPKLEDAPADVQELVRALEADEYVPGRVY